MSQGAEGRLYLSELFGQPCVVKERFVKKYRVPALDTKLTKNRMMQEVKSMDRVRRMGILAPSVYLVD
jgi:TP53 regulating kinase and related kinases